jgi:hypothetical protein
MKSHYLCISISLLFTSFLYFLLFSDKNGGECFLASLMILLFITSESFWYNPVRYSTLHRIDAALAKVTIFFFFLYTVLVKATLSNPCLLIQYSIVLAIILGSAALSEYYSQKQWLSDQHVFFHGLLHVSCFAGTFFAFIPIPVPVPIPISISIPIIPVSIPIPVVPVSL